MQTVKLKMFNCAIIHCCLLLATATTTATVAALEQKLLRINTDLTAAVAAAAAPEAASVMAAVVDDANVRNALAPATLAASHICMREETYVEQLKTPSMQPVRIRSTEWCLEFPPRCSNYKTEMREVLQVQNVTKTRTIRFCCAGYEGNISINDTVCKPVCHGGCGRGYCRMPDVCSCEAGYTGPHCTQRCDHDRWGEECKNECQCQNGAVCDNKTGLCHCTTGWTGELCQQPCPAGTYGVMCHKECDCENKLCHPQTGACETPNDPVTATPNATHVMIQTLNSTIVNITHNLDRIAKNIVNIASTSTSSISGAAELELYAATTTKPLPEVIVIKQNDQHAPKIIVHQPGAGGLLEELHSAASKTPEVIHVITAASGWPAHPNASANTHEHQLDLASFGGAGANAPALTPNVTPPASSAAEHDANLLTTLLIILLIIMIAIAMSFLYVYRRYHWQKTRAQARHASASAASTAEMGAAVSEGRLCEAGGKAFLKPLPDLPGFTQMVRNKIEGPECYDSPSNNSSITAAASYDYARKLSLYSVVTPKSRKGSPDSHLYDEIRYPSAFHHRPHAETHRHPPPPPPPTHQHHQHQPPPFQPTQHVSYVPPQPTAATHHVTHLIIPPQNANFLQVPPMSTNTTLRKVALL